MNISFFRRRVKCVVDSTEVAHSFAGDNLACRSCDWLSAASDTNAGKTRRGVLAFPVQMGALTAVGVAATEVLLPRPAAAAEEHPAPETPDGALANLMAGNRRYLGARLASCSEDFPRVLQETKDKQTPFAAILSCADSRVPVELIFDQGIGRIFVTRVAGNIASPEIIASLEYAVAVLGTRLIMVLGHGNCGAVSAAMTRRVAPGQISSLYAFIRPAIDRADGHADTAVRMNAQLQARLLGQSSPVLAEAVASKQLGIKPAYYDVGTGRVTVLPT